MGGREGERMNKEARSPDKPDHWWLKPELLALLVYCVSKTDVKCKCITIHVTDRITSVCIPPLGLRTAPRASHTLGMWPVSFYITFCVRVL